MTNPVLIWDLDGTLLDSYGVIVSSLRDTLAEFQEAPVPSAILHQVKDGSVSAFLKAASAETGVPYQRLKQRYSEISGSRILDIPLMPHAREILTAAEARGGVHFVYTHRGTTTAPVLDHLGLTTCFREVVTSLNGFPRKPAPDALLYLMEKYRLTREQVFYIGDRTLDVECAQNAGVRSILYSPEGQGTADFVVRDLLEIERIL